MPSISQPGRRHCNSHRAFLDDREDEGPMAGARKSDPMTEAQRRFEELLRRTVAYLKQQASLVCAAKRTPQRNERGN